MATTAILTGFVDTATARNRGYKGRFTVTPQRIDQNGDKLHIDIDITLTDLKVKSPLSIDFTPVLTAGDKHIELPSVFVKGHDEYLSYERGIALLNDKQRAAYDKPYAVVRADKPLNETLRYTYTLQYEEWMKDAELSIRRDDCGCGDLLSMVVDPLGKVSPEPVPYNVAPVPAYVQPQAEIKKREVQAEVFLNFVVNKTDIRPDYMDNPRELGKIHDMLKELVNDPDISVEKLEIIGYASPEGTLARNQILSEGRAMALRDYLAGRYHFPRDLYYISFGGENWAGLERALETLDMEHKDEVLDILENPSLTDGQKKVELMKLRSGNPFRFLLRNVFPSLRVAICKVDYAIRSFDLAEAREIFKTRPQNLSLNEMFLVANSYLAGSQEFNDVFDTAVRMFPDNETASLNAAAAALSAGNPKLAKRYMDKLGAEPANHKPEYYNNLGVMALLNGDLAGAEKHLGTAAAAGLKEAETNLNELNKKRENINLIESRNRRNPNN